MSVAQGADLAVKAPILAPVVAPVSWTGFLVFGDVGWGESNGNTNYTGTDSPSQAFIAATTQALGLPTSYNSNASGIVGGGGAEFDYQYSSFVFGLRGDYTYFGQTSTNSTTVALGNGRNAPSLTVTNKIGLVGIATARGVIGYSPVPNVLIYANVGPAFAQSSQEFIINTSPAFFGVDQPFDANTWGWTVGGGGRYLFDSHWFAQVEGNFFDLTNFSSDSTLGQINYRKTTSLTVADVTLGIGYKF